MDVRYPELIVYGTWSVIVVQDIFLQRYRWHHHQVFMHFRSTVGVYEAEIVTLLSEAGMSP